MPNYSTPELRKKYKQYCANYRQWLLNLHTHATTSQHPPPELPEECKNMRCGAKTRSNTPCKLDGTNYANGRCKFHGGRSTGPKTQAGKDKSALNSRKKTNPMNHR